MDFVHKTNVRSKYHIIALYVLFFFSGISGLAYETVWLRIMNRVVGNTVYATSVVLAAFMAGMALGGYVFGRYAARVKNQLRLYAFLELAVGISAAALTAALLRLGPIYQMFYALFAESRFALGAFQCVMAFTVMAIPATLMGGTLPVLSGYTRQFQAGFSSRIGLLYGLNTLGAVFGVLGGGFVTLGLWGETVTFLIGVGITVGVACLALLLSRKEWDCSTSAQNAESENQSSVSISPYSPTIRRWVGLAYALSGAVAMAYEVIWTRMFQIFVGTSIYAFSVMLASYLLGVGLGSLAGGRLFGNVRHPLRAFGVAQLFIAGYSVLGLVFCTFFNPVTLELSLTLGNVLVMPPLVIFPITAVLGGMFPLVCRCYVPNEKETSRAVGRLYSLNTFGGILGSLICGFVFIGLFGTRGTILFLAVVNCSLGLLFLIRESGEWSKRRVYGVSFASLAFLFLSFFAAPDPFQFALNRAMNRFYGERAEKAKIYFNKESATATTTAIGIDGDPFSKHLWVNGIGMTNLCYETKVMAHLPLLLHPEPHDALVICFGMGTTVRSMHAHKEIKCDVVELVPEVMECFKYFHSDAEEIVADPRIRRYADDGRNFLLVRSKKYDVISIDPAPPIWSAGTVNLYTQDFFTLCKSRLTEHGIMCLWIPPVQYSEMKMIMKSFQTVFPNTYVWKGSLSKTPGVLLMGYRNDQDPSFKGLRTNADEAAIRADFNEWPPYEIEDVNQTLGQLMVFTPREFAIFVSDEPIVTDDCPYTEFPLWRSLFDPSFHARLELR